MFGNHGLCGLLEEGGHGKSPKCLGGNLGDFWGDFAKVSDRQRLGANPKSFIVRIFKDDEDRTQCLKTINFPISSPDHLFHAQNAANEYGRLYVSGIMNKEHLQ